MPRRCVLEAARSRARPRSVRTASAPRASARQALRSTSPSSTSRSIRRVTPLLLRITSSASWRIRIRRSGAWAIVSERVVLADRQVVLGSQLLVEATDDPGVGEQERAPRREARVAWFERSFDRLGDGHGRDATPRDRAEGTLLRQPYPNARGDQRQLSESNR